MPISRYNVLIQERADLVAEGKALFAAAEAARRGLTAEELARDDAIQARVEELSAEIEREDRNRARQTLVDGRRVADHVPDVEVGIDRAGTKPWGVATGGRLVRADDGSTRVVGGHPFGEFLQAVARASLHPGRPVDPRLAYGVLGEDGEEPRYRAALGGFESGGADGGFLVGTDVAQGILRRMYEMGELLKRVRHIPIGEGSNALELNAVDETSRVTGSRLGGVQGYWTDEGSSITASRPKFKKVSLKLKKLACLGYATDELLADAAALEAVMTEAFTEELTFLSEDGIFEGTGGGQPLGLLNCPAVLSVAKETGQAAATIVKENIDKMYSRMWIQSRKNAAWLINVDCLPQLEQLSAVVGVGGVPVFIPAGGYSQAPNDRLKGCPVIPVEYCQTVGTVGDIVFADLSQYIVIDKGGIQQASSMHIAFTTDEMAFRTIYRVDGAPLWVSALTPFHGTNTLSPFVTLATRS